jgi:hypothetical protein
MTIDPGREMGPPVLATGNMRDVHRPLFVTPTGPTHPPAHPRTWGTRPLVHQPPLLLQYSIDRLLVHGPHGLSTQQRPEMSIPESQVLLNQRPELREPGQV